MTTKAMSYELTEPKVGNAKAIKQKATNEMLNKVSTSRILWHIVKRHKFGLVVTWGIIMTINYMFPQAWDILGSLVQSI
jgi:hypothetical protein